MSEPARPQPPPTTAPATRRAARKGPLVGSFEENVLNNRLEPIATVDGYRAELRASSCKFQPKPLSSPVPVSFFSAGSCFPYLGRLRLQRRGYRIPAKGTIQVALFNPLGTLVKLFLLLYDLTDMPANSQTFMRQRTVFEHLSSPNTGRVRYLIQFNIISSKSGRVYLHKDLRIFISTRADLEAAVQLDGCKYVLRSYDEMPKNPRYFSR